MLVSCYPLLQRCALRQESSIKTPKTEIVQVFSCERLRVEVLGDASHYTDHDYIGLLEYDRRISFFCVLIKLFFSSSPFCLSISDNQIVNYI